MAIYTVFMTQKPLILASGSPRRRDILTQHGVAFEIQKADVEECNNAHLHPKDIALKNAVLKAEYVARKNPNRKVLGADTVVCLNQTLYGKPKDLADARRMLGELAGKTHTVYTAVAVSVFTDGKMVTRNGSDATNVTFRKMDAADIEKYLAQVSVLDKAGAYAAQEHAELIIDKVDGNFDNVVGLPWSVCLELLGGQ